MADKKEFYEMTPRQQEATLKGKSPEEKVAIANYVPHGSDRHAQILGLKRGDDGEWELQDITQYGPMATERYLDQLLKQKVAALDGKPFIPQTQHPFQADYAPPMFDPDRLIPND